MFCMIQDSMDKQFKVASYIGKVGYYTVYNDIFKDPLCTSVQGHNKATSLKFEPEGEQGSPPTDHMLLKHVLGCVLDKKYLSFIIYTYR